MLDIACGTGAMISKLKQYCNLVEGADQSLAMIKIAKTKNKKVKYYRQDFLSLNTGKQYDVIISTFDSINYLIKKTDLNKAFIYIICLILAKNFLNHT